MTTDFGQFSIPELLSPREPLSRAEFSLTRQQQRQDVRLATAPDGNAADEPGEAAFSDPFQNRTAPFRFGDNPLGALATTVTAGPDARSPTEPGPGGPESTGNAGRNRTPAVEVATQGPYTNANNDLGIGSVLNTVAPASYGPGQLLDIVG